MASEDNDDLETEEDGEDTDDEEEDLDCDKDSENEKLSISKINPEIIESDLSEQEKDSLLRGYRRKTKEERQHERRQKREQNREKREYEKNMDFSEISYEIVGDEKIYQKIEASYDYSKTFNYDNPLIAKILKPYLNISLKQTSAMVEME